MKTLELLLGFWCLSVSLAELNLHLVEVSFHLLLQSESFIPAASLWFKWALQGINHSLLVPLGLLHLFIFLSQLTFNVSFDLIKLQLGPQDLTFLMFKRTLSVDENFLIKTTFLFYHVWLLLHVQQLKYPVSNGNRNCTLHNIPQPLPELLEFQIFPAPAAYEFSLVHECSFHSHQFVQWDQQSPLFNRQVNNG